MQPKTTKKNILNKYFYLPLVQIIYQYSKDTLLEKHMKELIKVGKKVCDCQIEYSLWQQLVTLGWDKFITNKLQQKFLKLPFFDIHECDCILTEHKKCWKNVHNTKYHKPIKTNIINDQTFIPTHHNSNTKQCPPYYIQFESSGLDDFGILFYFNESFDIIQPTLLIKPTKAAPERHDNEILYFNNYGEMINICYYRMIWKITGSILDPILNTPSSLKMIYFNNQVNINNSHDSVFPVLGYVNDDMDMNDLNFGDPTFEYNPTVADNNSDLNIFET